MARRLRVGDKVALAFGSGNRDWRKFPEPDVYDIERRPQGHLGFGAGKHFCLGSQMARLVTEVAMKRFLARVPELSPRGRQDRLEFVVEFSQPGCAAVRNALIVSRFRQSAVIRTRHGFVRCDIGLCIAHQQH